MNLVTNDPFMNCLLHNKLHKLLHSVLCELSTDRFLSFYLEFVSVSFG